MVKESELKRVAVEKPESRDESLGDIILQVEQGKDLQENLERLRLILNDFYSMFENVKILVEKHKAHRVLIRLIQDQESEELNKHKYRMLKLLGSLCEGYPETTKILIEDGALELFWQLFLTGLWGE